MAALTKARDTKRGASAVFPEKFDLPVAAATTIYQGGIVCVNSSNLAVPATATTGLRAVGRAEATVDNSAGLAGALTVPVTSTVLVYANSGGGDQITTSHQPGRSLYLVDDQTVALTSNSGARSFAGKLVKVDSLGVHVLVSPMLDDAQALSETTGAAAIGIADAGNYYAATTVEGALQEVRADLAATTTGNGASLIGIEDAATLYTAANVEAALAEVKALADAAPAMQAANATLVAGTVTINTGITVAADSEVVPVLIGAITGSTNFGSLSELKSSRVNGAPGTGTVVIRALGSDGALDADAAGAIRVVILTPQ